VAVSSYLRAMCIVFRPRANRQGSRSQIRLNVFPALLYVTRFGLGNANHGIEPEVDYTGPGQVHHGKVDRGNILSKAD
jgi:hypothetical protein